MMREGVLALVSAALLAIAAPGAALAESPDAVLAQFFAVWDDNGRVTPETVQSLYGRRVDYYGTTLSTAGVYANKRAFIRRWPDRRYTVVPGTVSKGCDHAVDRCAVGVTLAWRAASPERGAAASGWTRVSLVLQREDGELKIVRESGRPAPPPRG